MSIHEVWAAQDDAKYWQDEFEDLQKKHYRLKEKVQEYLNRPSSDGARIRQELREELKKLIK